MGEIALIIVYNHQYNKNIDVLEQHYKNRFSNIFHLVPFYNGTKENVIPVYENSYYFQGYVAQGLKSFYNIKFDNYIFVADDMIINPVINETNVKQYFKLYNNASFVPKFITLHKKKSYWKRTKEARKYKIKQRGVEAEPQLPTYLDAIKQFKNHGLEIDDLKFKQVYDTKLGGSLLVTARNLYNKLISPFLFWRRYKLNYPLVGSYSDIFIVNASTIKQFCHYCGVFSATNLFVELAIPTAMVLSTDNIVTENDLELKGLPLWSKDDFKILEKYNNNLTMLVNNFPEGVLYLHPIKLSKWK